MQLKHSLVPVYISNGSTGFIIGCFIREFEIDGLGIRHYFKALVSADDVKHSKPDPETYNKCAAALNTDPASCLVFEDAPKGVESALNAGMDAFVITSMHPAVDFVAYSNVIGFATDYDKVDWLIS